jgi:lipopolysaccharide biosynthesis glycosyltransferase
MDIALCFDSKYVMPCIVLITSILKTNPLENITFHIISSFLSDKDKIALNNTALNSYVAIKFYTIEDVHINKLPMEKRGSYLSLATYLRLYIPYILPKSISKILYLDCDMIVLGSLNPLWESDISGCPVAAVIDAACDDIRNANRLEYDPRLGYFNAGMLLMNLEYWRNNDVTKHCLSFLTNHPGRCRFHDQDALNHVLAGKWRAVSPAFNCLTPNIYTPADEWFIRTEYKSEMVNARIDPIVLHFSTQSKPWYKMCSSPLKEIWLYYKKQTIYKYKRLHFNGVSFFKELIKFILAKLNLYVPFYTVDAELKIDEISQRILSELIKYEK